MRRRASNNTRTGGDRRDDPIILGDSSDDDAPPTPPPVRRNKGKGKGKARAAPPPDTSDSDTGPLRLSQVLDDRAAQRKKATTSANAQASSSRPRTSSPKVKISNSQRPTPTTPKKRKASQSPVSPSQPRKSGFGYGANGHAGTSANGVRPAKRRATESQPAVPTGGRVTVAELSRNLSEAAGDPSRNNRPPSDSAPKSASANGPSGRPSSRAVQNHETNNQSGSGSGSSTHKEPRGVAPETAIVSDRTPGSWSNPLPLVAPRTRRTVSPARSAAERATASPALSPRTRPRPSSGTWENPEPMVTPAVPSSAAQRGSTSKRPGSRDSSGTWAQPEPLVVNTGRRMPRPHETDSSGLETEAPPRPKPTKARKTGGGKAPRRMPPLPSSQPEPAIQLQPVQPTASPRAPKWTTSASIPAQAPAQVPASATVATPPGDLEGPLDTGEPSIGDDVGEDIVMDRQDSPQPNAPLQDSSDFLEALDSRDDDLDGLESDDEPLEPQRHPSPPSPTSSQDALLDELDRDSGDDSGLELLDSGDERDGSEMSRPNGQTSTSRGQPSTLTNRPSASGSTVPAVGVSRSSHVGTATPTRLTSRPNGSTPSHSRPPNTDAEKTRRNRDELIRMFAPHPPVTRMLAPPLPVVVAQRNALPANGLTNGRHARVTASPSPEPEVITVTRGEYMEVLLNGHTQGLREHISRRPAANKTPFSGVREAQTSPIDDQPPPDRRGVAKRSEGGPKVHDIMKAASYLASRPELYCTIIEAIISVATSEDEPSAPEIKVVNPIDAVSSPPPIEYNYSNEMLYSSAVPDPELGKGCDCEGVCDPNSQTCSCAARQKLYFYNLGPTGFQWDENERIKQIDCTIWECGPTCGCPPECGNRVIQRGRQKNADVEIFKTEKKGWGVRARGRIDRGTFLGIYSGELITDAESERRASEHYDKLGTTYLFDLDGYHLTNPPEGLENIDPRAYELAMKVKERGEGCEPGKYSAYSVDAYHHGNYTRFINHSCEPNVSITQAYVKDFHPERPLLVMIARYDIYEGEELCISYKGTKDEEPPAPLLPESLRARSATPAQHGRSSVHISPRRRNECKMAHRCLCGMPNCNGNMFNWD